ncbi:MAG: hypothetical protein INH41_11210 [Myxococcaceae bacterium]|nr:hypothetical protein [Myxococcaceae bacterium]MCA3012949.1 hypothetical protein [Myxococcaceae bacterium]
MTANGGCDANATCTNTVGSRTCACNSGFSGNGLTCADINDCLTNNGGCGANRKCTNTVGSFTCGACNPGFASDGGATSDCSNINECLVRNGGCSFRVTCIDLTPTAPDFLPYRCGPCPRAFEGDGYFCWMINPCAMNNGRCSITPLVSCIAGANANTACDECPPGFSDPFAGQISNQGRICLDINECAPSGPTGGFCDAPLIEFNGDVCVNTFGGCDTVFTGDPVSTPGVCSGNGNGGCDGRTVCTASNTVPATPTCGACLSQPPVSPDAGGDGFNYRLPPSVSRPFQPGNGSSTPASNGANKCVQVNECDFNPCDPLAVCQDLEPFYLLDQQPGRFGTFNGFRCACGPGTVEGITNPGLDWTDPKAYNHKFEDGGVARCTPLPACATTCDPLVKCFRIDNIGSPIGCSTCPPGYVGSGYLAQGGCVPL